ncbi:hypothetical protein PV325_011676, partial [Microctonus aethiopoides]
WSPDFEGIFSGLGRIIHEAFKKHAYLRNSSLWNRPGYDKEIFMKYLDSEKSESLSEEELQSGLKILSKCLHGYYGKPVYVFIEELDRPLTRIIYGSRMTFKNKEKTIALFQMIFTKLLEGNECVERSLFNACHQVGGLFLQSVSNLDHYAFMQGHIFDEFYGFEEAEVMDLLKKAGKFEKFNEIKEKYNGYKTTLRDGRIIQIYSPYAILESLWDVEQGFDYISIRIKDGISHVKITPKILKLMSGECVTIKYVKNYGIKDIEILSKLSCDSEYETHRLIDDTVRFVNSTREYENPFRRSIQKFAESLENVAESCEEDSIRALADSIHVLFRVYFRKTRTYRNDCEVISVLFGTRCDALLVIEDHKVAFIFDCKSINKKSNYAHRQIIDRRYYTLIEKASLEEIFSKREMNLSIKNKIYLGIHSDKDCKVSITYSLNNMDPNIVVSKGA